MESLSFPPKRYVVRYPGTMAPRFPGAHAMQNTPFGQERHVLIVDDDPFFRSLLRVLLGQTGWPIVEIREAEDSLTAIEISRTHAVDLVFCDLNLAKFRSENGLEVIKELRLTHQTIPIFMVSAENSETLVEEIRAAGATGHLLKPINLRSLKGIFAC